MAKNKPKKITPKRAVDMVREHLKRKGDAKRARGKKGKK